MKIDLHAHTCYSDGALTPEELVMRAHNQQVDVLALTDHDTVDAIAEAQQYQAQQKRAMTIVPGVELSTSWHGFDIHIVGLNIDWQDPLFTERLQQQQNAREERARLIGDKLEKAGLGNVYDVAARLAGKGQITRAHFARALLESNQVSSLETAFRKYLGKGKRAHVSPRWISVAEAVQWINDAGGSAVLAHPGRYDMTAKWLRRLIVEFKQAGGHALEVIYPGMSPALKKQMANYAIEYELLASTGSDFHAPGRWSELGRHLALPETVKPVWSDWLSELAA
ncbi:PHP domain-containing protein [Paraneptunicella aestuarii]|uniref:PHP domain-containing protein n=1 Tax=Paraneptunicella aestuarii TaxID=2831148 RepID=UPI001E3F3F31|nr:PHP domain-containing protein [Paraneptunicella aestuarii]UAA37345.1 PHP domain-containing protein [Paraneptunicella aestuarii]